MSTFPALLQSISEGAERITLSVDLSNEEKELLWELLPHSNCKIARVELNEAFVDLLQEEWDLKGVLDEDTLLIFDHYKQSNCKNLK